MTEIEAMREATEEQLTTASSGAADLYERLRDSAPKEAKVEWRDGDRWASSLRAKLQELAADESLSEQGRFDKARVHIENATQKIQGGYEKAAKWLEKEAQKKALASVPLPDGHNLTFKVKDSTALLAIQAEAQAIISKVERRREKMPKGIKNQADHVLDMLRDTYASAMDDGGVEGMARARGVLRAAEQLGVERDVVVAPFMEREHFEAADEARQLEYLRKQVPSPRSMIPSNPFAPESKPRGEYHTARGANIFRPRTSAPDKSAQRSDGRRRPWK